MYSYGFSTKYYVEIYVYGNTYNNGAWSVTGTNSGKHFLPI